MNAIGERLAEERKRLKMSQEEFGAIGGVKKLAQFNYEKGVRMPDAGYLSAIAAIGADVLYIITGTRTQMPEQPSLPTSTADETFEIAKQLPEEAQQELLEHAKRRRRDTEREQALQVELERLGGGAGKRSA